MIKALVLTIQFLTRLPLKIEVDFNEETIKKATFFFPYVGSLIALITYIPYRLLIDYNLELAAIFALFTSVIITGGLHLDGLSDTADGFLSARSKDKVLEIMKDSRIGAFGVIAIVFDILFKFILIKNIEPKNALISFVLSFGIARLCAALLFTIGKSARKDGLGTLFTGKERIQYFICSALTFSIICFYFARIKYLIILLIAFLTAFVIMKRSYKIIDGLTGDVYGACIEICEIVSLLSLVMLE